MKGFTLVEVLICGIIFIVLSLFIFGAVRGGASILSGSSNVSWGLNGMTETRCIGGYKFIIGEGGQARQIMDSYGKGVPCQ